MADLEAPEAEDAERAEEGSLAFVVVDDDCRCLDATDDACRLLGAMREEILGIGLDEVLAEDARERFAHIWRAFRSRGGHAGPFRVAATIPFDVDVDVTAEVLPSRHLVLLTSARSNFRVNVAGEPGNGAPGLQPGARRGQPTPTSRECQILRMLAAGGTDGQIAGRLSLSPATVRTHVRNAKTKLGASTRAQAVALALERRMIG